MGQRYLITFQSPQMSCVARKLKQGTRLVETGRGFDRTDKLRAFRFFLQKPQIYSDPDLGYHHPYMLSLHANSLAGASTRVKPVARTRPRRVVYDSWN